MHTYSFRKAQGFEPKMNLSTFGRDIYSLVGHTSNPVASHICTYMLQEGL